MDDSKEKQLEKVRKAVSESNLPELEWSTILGAFNEEGIRSLEDLAKRLVDTFRDASSFPQAIDLSVLSRLTPKSISKQIVHKVPKYPLLRAGVLYDPKDIVRFNGQVLLYVVDSRFHDSILIIDDPETIRTILSVQIFSGISDRWASIRDVVESKAVPPSNPPLTPQGEEPEVQPPAFDQYPYRSKSSPDLRLFSRKGWGGNRLDVRAGTQWSDLTKAWIFYPFDDWNDEINSMFPTSSVHIFKEHVNFVGSFLILPKHTFISNFGDYGWDARVSSVANYG